MWSKLDFKSIKCRVLFKKQRIVLKFQRTNEEASSEIEIEKEDKPIITEMNGNWNYKNFANSNMRENIKIFINHQQRSQKLINQNELINTQRVTQSMAWQKKI